MVYLVEMLYLFIKIISCIDITLLKEVNRS